MTFEDLTTNKAKHADGAGAVKELVLYNSCDASMMI